MNNYDLHCETWMGKCKIHGCNFDVHENRQQFLRESCPLCESETRLAAGLALLRKGPHLGRDIRMLIMHICQFQRLAKFIYKRHHELAKGDVIRVSVLRGKYGVLSRVKNIKYTDNSHLVVTHKRNVFKRDSHLIWWLSCKVFLGKLASYNESIYVPT